MLKNITLSADAQLIAKARKKAQSDNTTLNAQFREWLEKYTRLGKPASDYEQLMQRMNYAQPTKKYSRDELNER